MRVDNDSKTAQNNHDERSLDSKMQWKMVTEKQDLLTSAAPAVSNSIRITDAENGVPTTVGSNRGNHRRSTGQIDLVRKSTGRCEFFELAIERTRGDAQSLRGFGFVAVGLAQRIFDDAAFTFFDVADRFTADLVAMASGVLL